MIENNEDTSNGVLGRLVDDEGEMKEPSHCIIQYGGRVRLPDKLMEILNKEFAPDVMWWQPDGECFAFDSEKVQKKILDVWFRGTKLSSFIRSLNRWGFRRVFYHALPEASLAFHHAAFRKTSTLEMLKTMKMCKSGKATSVAKNEAPPSAASSVPPAEISISTTSSSSASAPALSLVQAAASRTSPLSQVTTASVAPSSLSLLSQLPSLTRGSSATTSTIGATSAVNQQEALLKLLVEQRNRDLLTLAATAGGSSRLSALPSTTLNNLTLANLGTAASQVLPTTAVVAAPSPLQTALAALRQQQQQQPRPVSDGDQQNLLLLARAEQELRTQRSLAQVQQQQQRNDAALRVARLVLNNLKPSQS